MKFNHDTIIMILIIILGFFVSITLKEIADEFTTSREISADLITDKNIIGGMGKTYELKQFIK